MDNLFLRFPGLDIVSEYCSRRETRKSSIQSFCLRWGKLKRILLKRIYHLTKRKRWLVYEVLMFPECIRELRSQGTPHAEGRTETLIKNILKLQPLSWARNVTRAIWILGYPKDDHSKNRNQIQVKSWLHWFNPHTDNLPNKDLYQFPGINTIFYDPTAQYKMPSTETRIIKNIKKQ